MACDACDMPAPSSFLREGCVRRKRVRTALVSVTATRIHTGATVTVTTRVNLELPELVSNSANSAQLWWEELQRAVTCALSHYLAFRPFCSGMF